MGTAPATSAAADEIVRAVEDLYAAFLAGDRARFDGHLHPDVTTWETHLPSLLPDRQALDHYRDQRPADAVPDLRSLDVEAPRVDVWGDTALARYELVATPRTGEATPPSRVTDVLRRIDGRWLIVHHHAESAGEVAG